MDNGNWNEGPDGGNRQTGGRNDQEQPEPGRRHDPSLRYQILEVRSNEEEEGKEADKPGQSQLAVEPGKCSLQGCVLCNSRTRKSREGL